MIVTNRNPGGTVPLDVEVEVGAPPTHYLSLLSREHGLIRIAVFERDGGTAAMFSAGQMLPDELRPRPHVTGLASPKDVEAWAIAAAAGRGVVLEAVKLPEMGTYEYPAAAAVAYEVVDAVPLPGDPTASTGRIVETSLGYTTPALEQARAAFAAARGWGKASASLAQLPSRPLRARGWRWRR